MDTRFLYFGQCKCHAKIDNNYNQQLTSCIGKIRALNLIIGNETSDTTIDMLELVVFSKI